MSFIKLPERTLQEVFDFRREEAEKRNKRAMKNSSEVEEGANQLYSTLSNIQRSVNQRELLNAIRDQSSASFNKTLKARQKEIVDTSRESDVGILTIEDIDSISDADTYIKHYNKIAKYLDKPLVVKETGTAREKLIKLAYNFNNNFYKDEIFSNHNGKPLILKQNDSLGRPYPSVIYQLIGLTPITVSKLLEYLNRKLMLINELAKLKFSKRPRTNVVESEMVMQSGDKEPQGSSSDHIVVDGQTVKTVDTIPSSSNILKEEYSRLSALNGNYNSFDQLSRAIMATIKRKKKMTPEERKLVIKNIEMLKDKDYIDELSYANIMSRI